MKLIITIKQRDDLLDYFEDTYIGRYRLNAPRRPPMFPSALWNMYHRTDDELPRTNNNVEGWYRALKNHMTIGHMMNSNSCGIYSII